MGDAVNLASRPRGPQQALRHAGARERGHGAAGPGVETRRLERVAVAGRKGGVLVVELLGRRGEVDPATLAARDAYEAALDAFHGRRFDAAEDGFREAAAARPEDLAPRLLLARLEASRSFPPPADWDGTEVILEK
jgi:adenylate cyclase